MTEWLSVCVWRTRLWLILQIAFSSSSKSHKLGQGVFTFREYVMISPLTHMFLTLNRPYIWGEHGDLFILLLTNWCNCFLSANKLNFTGRITQMWVTTWFFVSRSRSTKKIAKIFPWVDEFIGIGFNSLSYMIIEKLNIMCLWCV